MILMLFSVRGLGSRCVMGDFAMPRNWPCLYSLALWLLNRYPLDLLPWTTRWSGTLIIARKIGHE